MKMISELYHGSLMHSDCVPSRSQQMYSWHHTLWLNGSEKENAVHSVQLLGDTSIKLKKVLSHLGQQHLEV